MGEAVTLDVRLQAFVRKEKKDRWVSVCPRIGVASQGRSADEAKQSLQEAVELWFESCLERGVLDQAMRESGFRALQAEDSSDDSERVLMRRSRSDESILGDAFNVHLEIPAYQAAQFLSNPA